MRYQLNATIFIEANDKQTLQNRIQNETVFDLLERAEIGAIQIACQELNRPVKTKCRMCGEKTTGNLCDDCQERNRPADDGQRAEQLLEIARTKQTAFWEALHELEQALGEIEIDGTKDLQDWEIDDLTAAADDDECTECHGSNTNGEGWDGRCGSCADKEFTCKGCGRAEDVCSADPCPGVIRDRES